MANGTFCSTLFYSSLEATGTGGRERRQFNLSKEGNQPNNLKECNKTFNKTSAASTSLHM